MKDMNQQMVATIEAVTPAMAAEWLNRNISNRPLRPWWVGQLAAKIERGEWMVTHQGVAFDQSGVLLDGQHRLRAIVQAGKTCEMVVWRGADPMSFAVVDTGVLRTFADQSDVDKRVAPVLLFAGRLVFGTRPSFQQMQPLISSRMRTLLDELVGFCGTAVKTYAAAAVKLGLAANVILGNSEQQYAFNLYRALVLGDYEQMPPIGHAASRQFRDVKAFNREDLLARSFAIFDQSRAEASRLQVKDPTVALKEVRKAIMSQVGEVA